MINVIFDMETSDPDDVFTLCFLTSHPAINLCAVTITPGSFEQVGLVKAVLKYTGKEHVPIGADGHHKSCVSSFHDKLISFSPEEPKIQAAELIAHTLLTCPDTVLLTGGPLKNLHKFLDKYNVRIDRWVAQGGFAGDNVVPEEHRLDKFKGRNSCPTFNFNGDPEGAMMALKTKQISLRHLVSKNVCHGIAYDHAMHDKVAPHADKTPGLQLMYKGMDIYLKKNPAGKLFHDPLAAAVVIDPSVCEFKEVEMYRNRGEWGANPKEGTNTFISISGSRQKLIDILTTTG